MKDELKDLILESIDKDDDFKTAHCLFEALDHSGSVHEIIEGHIDIYYYNLRKWAVDNWHFIDEAREMGFISENADYHQSIQSGQFLAFEQEAHQHIEELFNELSGTYFNLS